MRRVADPLVSGPRTAQLSLLLCSDRVIQDLNRRWLGRDRPTSVIAFPSPALEAHTSRTGPLDPVPGVLDPFVEAGPPSHLGDVAVSVDTARRESRTDDRILYLALHGLLHVLGWDHDGERAWRRMHRVTLRLLARRR